MNCEEQINCRSKQNARILLFVNKYGSINPKQALTELGVMRLAARIGEIEKAGIHFDRKKIIDTNRFGEVVRYMEYKLTKGESVNANCELHS